jgi:hypothetical protein
VRFPYQGRYPPATWPDTLKDDGDDGNVDGAKDGTSSDGCSSGLGAVWVFCLVSGGLSGVIWTPFERKVFLRDAPGLPLAPPWGLGTSGAQGRGRSLLFPFLAWSWIPPSSSDFGTCPGNHSASIFQVYPFAVVQWGLLHLIGGSAPAPEAAGWTTVIVHVASTFLGFAPSSMS